MFLNAENQDIGLETALIQEVDLQEEDQDLVLLEDAEVLQKEIEALEEDHQNVIVHQDVEIDLVPLNRILRRDLLKTLQRILQDLLKKTLRKTKKYLHKEILKVDKAI